MEHGANVGIVGSYTDGRLDTCRALCTALYESPVSIMNTGSEEIRGRTGGWSGHAVRRAIPTGWVRAHRKETRLQWMVEVVKEEGREKIEEHRRRYLWSATRISRWNVRRWLGTHSAPVKMPKTALANDCSEGKVMMTALHRDAQALCGAQS